MAVAGQGLGGVDGAILAAALDSRVQGKVKWEEK
jgi:hypothetical protein